MKDKAKERRPSRLKLGLMDIIDHTQFKKEVRNLLMDPDSKMNQLGIKMKEDGHDNILYYQMSINYGDLVKYNYEERRLVYSSIKPQVEYLAEMWPTRLSCDDDDIYRIERTGDGDSSTLSYIVYFRFIYDALSVKWIVSFVISSVLILCGLTTAIVLLCRIL